MLKSWFGDEFMILPEYLKDIYHYTVGLVVNHPEEVLSNPVELSTRKTNIFFQDSVEAGPLVKFDSVNWDDSPTWKVSILLLTKEGALPPYLTFNKKKIAPTEVFCFDNRILWRYPLQAALEDHSRFIDYSLGGVGFQCYIPNKEDPWMIDYIANGVVEEVDVSDDDDNDSFFGGLFTERTALNVVEVSSSHFKRVFEIPEVREWIEEKSVSIQSSKTMSVSTKQKVADYFLKTYSELFTRMMGKVTPYLALSGGKNLIDSLDDELVEMPFALELKRIDTLFKNIFFHHSAESMTADEPSQPYTLHNLKYFHWLCMDLSVARSTNKWMLTRTWRALAADLLECCESGANQLVINMNIPLVTEKVGKVTQSVSLLSYINPLEYLPKSTCLYEWQLEEFFKTLQGIQEKYSIEITILSHWEEKGELYVLKVAKKGEDVDTSKSLFVPISERLMVVNENNINDTERLAIVMNLSYEVEVSDSQGVVLFAEDDVMNVLDELRLKERVGYKSLIWPFKKIT